MRISVIIPAYNAALTIREALASVEAQGMDDVEVIVVDDASRDDTPHILQSEYEGKFGYTLVLRQRNAGPATARNDAIALARGEWLAFLDGDDAWLPDRLAVQLNLADQHPDVALWCGAVVPLNPEPETLTEIRRQRRELKMTAGLPPEADAGPLDGGTLPFRKIDPREFVHHNPVATSTVLVRAEAVRQVGGFDPQFVGPEDYDLWMRLSMRVALARIDRPLSRYRFVPGSLSMDDRKFLPQVLGVLDKAFAPGGALAGMSGLRDHALANQYWNASWMAFNRGARGTALRFWWRARTLDRRASGGLARPWWRLLARYVAGRPESAGVAGS